MTSNKKIERVIQLFEFLKAYHKLKTPIISQITQYDWNIEVHAQEVNEEDPQIILKVDNTQKELFEGLYNVYIRMKKEPEAIELVWGDMVLTQKEGTAIYHPLLLEAIQLEFDIDTEIFTLKKSDKPVELMENLLGLIHHGKEQKIVESIKYFQKHPFGSIGQEWDEDFVELLQDGMKKSEATITNQAILFLRKRQIGFQVTIDQIIEDLYGRKEIPGFIADIVGLGDQVRKNQRGKDNLKKQNLEINGLDQKVIFTKPANTEQLLVAKQLERNDAVLVQGPPGTGKTHTIANILGHLLAEGKSVLVTSYSEKALDVVKEQVAKELQALCISLLGDAESRKELESSLDAIHTKRATLEKNDLIRRVNSHEKNRDICIKTLEKLRGEVRAIKLNEYTPFRVGGKMYKPVEAAKYVYTHKESCEWLVGPVRAGVALPLSKDELKELYDTAHTMNKEEEYICNWDVELGDFIKPEDFELIVEKENAVRGLEVPKWLDYYKHQDLDVATLKTLITEIELTTKTLEVEQAWAKEALLAGTDEKARDKWQGLAINIKEVYQLGLTYADELMNYQPEVSLQDETIKPLDIYSQINQKLRNGGRISKITLWLNPIIKKVIEASRTNGKIPETPQEFEALIHYTVLEEKRQQLKIRWDRQMQDLGAKPAEAFGEAFEVECQKYGESILRYLDWYKKKWLPLAKRIEASGIDIGRVNELSDLTNLEYGEIEYIKDTLAPNIIEILNYQVLTIQKEQNKVAKNQMIECINSYPEAVHSEVILGLKRTINTNKSEEYTAYYEQIVEARNKIPQLKNYQELLAKLEYAAVGWAELFKNAQGTQELTLQDNVEDAWLYRQLVEMIEKRNERTIEDVKTEMAEYEKRLGHYTRQLAQDRAWLHKLADFENNRTQVQSIEAWKQLIIKIGAGKGRQVELLKSEARKIMPKCQKAVPVWIMPLNKVAEHFDPKENKFDVVIIDEASQADMLALTALYLGKQILIVGDHEQVSPLAIGERHEDMDRLIKTYLEDMPHNYLYSGRFSIYDLAQVSGYQPVKLKEHFRCVPEIIGFSNGLSYDGQIEPLREGGDKGLNPAINTQYIAHAKEASQVNEKEAEFITKQIIECCKNPEYKGKTFGVISLKGDKQASYIDQLLQKEMTLSAYTERRILCGNPSHFQGDERDVIFISLVEAVEEGQKARLVSYGTDNLYKKRYNVAMSRAKDQVWIVHSFDPITQLKDEDIRKQLFNYCENIGKEAQQEERLYEEPLPEFEVQIKGLIENEGFKVETHNKDGSLLTGLIVSNEGKKVRVVCDSEKWQEEMELEDEINRQTVLERLGWQFIYLSATAFYANEEVATQKLMNQLKVALEVIK